MLVRTVWDYGGSGRIHRAHSAFAKLVDHALAQMSSDAKNGAKNGAPAKRQKQHTEEWEFGGPWGVVGIMIFSHCLVYYCWICLTYYDGGIAYPSGLSDLLPFARRLAGHIWEGAFPTAYAFKMYWGFVLFEALLQYVCPGVVMKGLPLEHEGGKQLEYNCNALLAWYITLALWIYLQWSGLFPWSTLMHHYGPLLSVSVISGNVIAILTYVITIAMGKQYRMSGNVLYDFFMGACLNPRIGSLDLKMFAEIRISWMLLFFLTTSCAAYMFEQHGSVSYPILFLCLAHGLYTNACMKGEVRGRAREAGRGAGRACARGGPRATTGGAAWRRAQLKHRPPHARPPSAVARPAPLVARQECIPSTWDIFYEKNGWMLIFWNFAGAPRRASPAAVRRRWRCGSDARPGRVAGAALFGRPCLCALQVCPSCTASSRCTWPRWPARSSTRRGTPRRCTARSSSRTTSGTRQTRRRIISECSSLVRARASAGAQSRGRTARHERVAGHGACAARRARGAPSPRHPTPPHPHPPAPAPARPIPPTWQARTSRGRLPFPSCRGRRSRLPSTSRRSAAPCCSSAAGGRTRARSTTARIWSCRCAGG